MAPKYELCVGLNKGQKTTKIIQKQYKGERKEKGIRQARKKNVSNPNTDFITKTWLPNQEISLLKWWKHN